MNKEIEELREKITEVDTKMATLLQERLTLVDKIGSLKRQNKIPVTDSSREADVLENYLKHISPCYHTPATAFVKCCLEISRSLQR